MSHSDYYEKLMAKCRAKADAKKEKARKIRTERWVAAGKKAREKNKKKRDAEREKEKERLRLKKEKERAKKLAMPKKKRIGRPRKPGPKKKRRYISKKPKVNNRIRFDYKIVTTLNGKQKEYIGKYYNLEEAYKALHKLEDDNKNIVFPREIINRGALLESKDEYLLLKKNRSGEETNGILRNEYGMLVEYATTNENWVVLDKCERKVEETFWVYGYDPKIDRKTFMWSLENLILEKLSGEYEIARICIYLNKIIIRHDNLPLDIIICKSMGDAIRFYNLLMEKCKGNKKVFFMGSYSNISEKRRQLELEISDVTGWDLRKIRRRSTRP